MPRDLLDGVYEHVVTQALAKAIARIDAQLRSVSTRGLEDHEAPGFLARAIGSEVEIVLRSLRSPNLPIERIRICNDLLDLLYRRARLSISDEAELDPAGLLLEAIHTTPQPPLRPVTPLGRTSLLTGARREPRFGSELIAEIATADRVDAIVAFVTWRGWQQLKSVLERFSNERRRFRLLTTVYMGASDQAALDALALLPGVEVRISYDTRRTRLHAKAWLFQRLTGLSTAYVGSANLSAAALGDGLEWTVKLSEASDPDVIEKFRGEYETLWATPEFERYDPSNASESARLRMALDGALGGAPTTALFFDLRPYPFQQEILDTLRREREELGRMRNLIVSATGTGKTLIAAFDYKKLVEARGLAPRLLFVAHRDEILDQAQYAFRNVLHDGAFGERLGGGHEPSSYDHLFATINSINSRRLLERPGPGHWDFVVVDEIHHGAADTYSSFLDLIRPQILLGLTATPERTDGRDILHWFGGREAAKIRLWDALDKRLLVPFDYYGLHDGTDLSAVRWSRGGYDLGELTNLYTHNDLRARLVLAEFQKKHGDVRRARALGFCVSVEHAVYMARKFNEAGLPALAVHGNSPEEDRRSARGRLARRELNVLFTCDLFNEGVDLPQVDTLLLLRPTESSLLFQQQLGRGLRLSEGKKSALVLDFIGQSRREFRFDAKLSVLTGLTRRELRDEVTAGFPLLPPGCSLQLDQVAQKIVLENLRQTLRVSMVDLCRDLTELRQRLDAADLSMRRFLDETGRPAEDLYADSVGGWTALRRAAGVMPPDSTEDERKLNSRFGRFLQVADSARFSAWSAIWGVRNEPSVPPGAHADRLFCMLASLLWDFSDRPRSAETCLEVLSGNRALASEFGEIGELLRDRGVVSKSAQPVEPGWPLLLHHRYTSDEVLAAVGASSFSEPKKLAGKGVWYLPDQKADLFFVTINKSAKLFSVSTRYEDYAISPTLFHWQSQSTTPEDSPTGTRYREGGGHGYRFFLFVRENRESALRTAEPFVFLGPAEFESHTGSRPMNVVWRLTYPIPPRYLESFTSFRAA